MKLSNHLRVCKYEGFLLSNMRAYSRGMILKPKANQLRRIKTWSKNEIKNLYIAYTLKVSLILTNILKSSSFWLVMPEIISLYLKKQTMLSTLLSIKSQISVIVAEKTSHAFNPPFNKESNIIINLLLSLPLPMPDVFLLFSIYSNYVSWIFISKVRVHNSRHITDRIFTILLYLILL